MENKNINETLFIRIEDIYPKNFEGVLTTTNNTDWILVSMPKNLGQFSKIKGFEAIVTKLNDDRTWVRINGREYLLDEMKQIVSNSDRAADLPVDYNWRKEYERRDKSIGNSGYSVKLEYTKEELYKTMCDDSNYIWSPFADSNNY